MRIYMCTYIFRICQMTIWDLQSDPVIKRFKGWSLLWLPSVHEGSLLKKKLQLHMCVVNNYHIECNTQTGWCIGVVILWGGPQHMVDAGGVMPITLCDNLYGMLRMFDNVHTHTHIHTHRHTHKTCCTFYIKVVTFSPRLHERSNAADRPPPKQRWECHSVFMCVCGGVW